MLILSKRLWTEQKMDFYQLGCSFVKNKNQSGKGAGGSRIPGVIIPQRVYSLAEISILWQTVQTWNGQF